MTKQILFYLCFCCVFTSLAYAFDTPKLFKKDNCLPRGVIMMDSAVVI